MMNNRFLTFSDRLLRGAIAAVIFGALPLGGATAFANSIDNVSDAASVTGHEAVKSASAVKNGAASGADGVTSTSVSGEAVAKSTPAAPVALRNEAALRPAALADTAGFRKFRFGGYGEMIAEFKDYGINRFDGTSTGNARTHRNTVSIPRFVLALDYKFTPKWILGAEIEFESGGVGSAVELENSENGEYETEIEKGGEVALEQFHITRLIHPAFNVRVGHLIVPVGLTNSHHEPINFFGTRRPEAETKLIPSTWHETGLAFFGSFGKRKAQFDYQLMVVAGLNANGFDRDEWVIGGKEGVFENDNFTSPGYVARLDYVGVPGLRIGWSGYYCRDAGSNSDKQHTYSSIGRIPVAITTFDAQWRSSLITARGNLTYGYVGNAAGVSEINRMLSNKSPYSRLVPVAKNAISYGAELGVNLRKAIGGDFPVIYPFARYEYYNPQYRGQGKQNMDKRLEVSQWQFGLNWFALPNLVVKADWTGRQIGTAKVFGKGDYNSENEFALGVAYVGWFIKK
ncbi:hypothetical protein [uncultured Duncaniella sp.]|uniref:hypothetical protein n=1 Tax=uncultured Duncaniella sp. TaxID=2768039 RepID=UPI00262AB372|nr:hypothetical protein [uncultured Duncaniella sp.]